ncbi:MAG: hypothetical protein COW89_10960, partial [Nitrospinae bacterium CG22_combo_CG10-13_8_21_14_all_47_10]
RQKIKITGAFDLRKGLTWHEAVILSKNFHMPQRGTTLPLVQGTQDSLMNFAVQLNHVSVTTNYS